MTVDAELPPVPRPRLPLFPQPPLSVLGVEVLLEEPLELAAALLFLALGTAAVRTDATLPTVPAAVAPGGLSALRRRGGGDARLAALRRRGGREARLATLEAAGRGGGLAIGQTALATVRRRGYFGGGVSPRGRRSVYEQVIVVLLLEPPYHMLSPVLHAVQGERELVAVLVELLLLGYVAQFPCSLRLDLLVRYFLYGIHDLVV